MLLIADLNRLWVYLVFPDLSRLRLLRVSAQKFFHNVYFSLNSDSVIEGSVVINFFKAPTVLSIGLLERASDDLLYLELTHLKIVTCKQVEQCLPSVND